MKTIYIKWIDSNIIFETKPMKTKPNEYKPPRDVGDYIVIASPWILVLILWIIFAIIENNL